MITLSNVDLTYSSGTHALRNLSLSICAGEFAFLVGPSGSGKSSIVRLLTAEIKPDAGAVVVDKFDINFLRRSQIPRLRQAIGVVFQDFRLIEKQTVYENIALAMRVSGVSGSRIRQRVAYVMELVGIDHKAKEYPGGLSGGEQQRAAIARALVNNPRLIVADEPTGNLDPARALEIMSLFDKINQLGTTILVVTHERELVDRFDKRVIAINDGEVVSDQRGGYFTYE